MTIFDISHTLDALKTFSETDWYYAAISVVFPCLYLQVFGKCTTEPSLDYWRFSFQIRALGLNGRNILYLLFNTFGKLRLSFL